MRSVRTTVLGGSALLLLAGAGALACGPSFPWQLLDNRTATLRDLPVDSFFFQATHLLPRPDPALREPAPAPIGAADAASSSCAALNDPAEGGAADAALLAGYTAGAAAFGHGDAAAAANAFRGAVSSATGPTTHALCATFMLGRSLDRSGDAAGARLAFLRTRELASHGAPDTLGLAVASFGEQARLALKQSGLAVGITPPAEPTAPTPDRLAALHAAVTLYSQQAAYGSQSGIDSLQEIAEALFSPQPGAETWFDAAGADPRTRQLLVAYALADTPAVENSDETGDGDVVNPLLGSLDAKPVTARLLDRLAPVFDPAADPRDAGRLAAVAYIAGRYDLAARFAASPQDPLSAWIRAKLSLQHDDLAASARAFDAAARAAAAQPDAMGETADRLRAEPAVIAVGQGDFEHALRLLYGFGPAYWGDVAYVAERLLRTDALRRVVAGLPPPGPLPPRDAIEDALIYPWPPGQSLRDAFRPDLAIRELLARRLMREGRWRDAEAAFVLPANRAAAVRYADAVARSNTAFWRTDRARGAWEAALLSRRNGMALFGTEVQPDEHVTGGAYDGGYGPNQTPAGAYVTGSEKQRYAASAPRPDRRFHYRFGAAAEAERAALLLPPRSQAYAAVLCAGAVWLAHAGDEAGAGRVYRLYVARGALLPKGMVFGASCPAPEFDEASRLRWSLPFRRVGWSLSRHWHGLVNRLGA